MTATAWCASLRSGGMVLKVYVNKSLTSEMTLCGRGRRHVRPHRISSSGWSPIRRGHFIRERFKSKDDFACPLTIANDTIERLSEFLLI
jgi:hypothetical protein